MWGTLPNGRGPYHIHRSLQALAQALRLAYERNRQAERYHLRGAVRAARHEATQLALHLGAAQQQLQALRNTLERCVS